MSIDVPTQVYICGLTDSIIREREGEREVSAKKEKERKKKEHVGDDWFVRRIAHRVSARYEESEREYNRLNHVYDTSTSRLICI